MKKKEVKEEILGPAGFPEEPSLPEKPKVGKLDLSFPNEDFNKLVSKINEIIESI